MFSCNISIVVYWFIYTYNVDVMTDSMRHATITSSLDLTQLHTPFYVEIFSLNNFRTADRLLRIAPCISHAV